MTDLIAYKTNGQIPGHTGLTKHRKKLVKGTAVLMKPVNDAAQ